MRIIDKTYYFKRRKLSILLTFTPSLWKWYWFEIKNEEIIKLGKRLDIMFLGVQFRMIYYKFRKEYAQEEFIKYLNNTKARKHSSKLLKDLLNK